VGGLRPKKKVKPPLGGLRAARTDDTVETYVPVSSFKRERSWLREVPQSHKTGGPGRGLKRGKRSPVEPQGGGGRGNKAGQGNPILPAFGVGNVDREEKRLHLNSTMNRFYWDIPDFPRKLGRA